MKLLLAHIIPACLIIATAPDLLTAAEVTPGATTIIRFEQRDPGSEGRDLMPVTQYLGLDATRLADGNLSLHLHGWGRTDLAETSYGKSKQAGDLSYGYLRYRIPSTDGDVRAGRFFVREGIVSEQVDGLSARTDLPFGFTLSVFGGATVHTRDLIDESSDGKGDYIAGGRLGYRHGGVVEIGLSGVYEDEAPELRTHANASNRKVGGDIWFSPHRSLELVGRTSYNPEVNELAEHRYQLNLRPLTELTISGEFSEQRDRSLLLAWAMFSAPRIDPDNRSRLAGVTISYGTAKPATLSLHYKHYDREAGNADRYGGDLKLNLLDNSLRTGLGYFYLDADDAFAIPGTASASYHNIRAYAMHDARSHFASVDALCQLFDEKIRNEDRGCEGSISLGFRLTPSLALSGDVSYGRNPEYRDETRGLVRLTYNATFGDTGGKK